MNTNNPPTSDILVIDDNPAQLEQILEHISRLGLRADSAVQAAHGEWLFSTGNYRLVLIDGYRAGSDVPFLDVPAIVQRMRTIEAGRPGMPASAMFSWASSQDTHASKRYSDAGITACLPRPDSPAGWREAVVSCIGHADLRGPTAAAPAMAAGGSEPPLSISALEQLCGGDLTMANEIFELYIATSEEDSRALASAIAGRNALEVKTASHRMKGAAQILSADAFARQCQVIELAAAASTTDWTFIDSQHGQLLIERQRLAQFMLQHIGPG